mmetsp:Transcript_27235/g.64557  ORF Transcript_27235/g.64557 Transcript_27235/m.64557 type:complete len:224 (-) Transcript_27235:674-1345(-)
MSMWPCRWHPTRHVRMVGAASELARMWPSILGEAPIEGRRRGPRRRPCARWWHPIAGSVWWGARRRGAPGTWLRSGHVGDRAAREGGRGRAIAWWSACHWWRVGHHGGRGPCATAHSSRTANRARASATPPPASSVDRGLRLGDAEAAVAEGLTVQAECLICRLDTLKLNPGKPAALAHCYDLPHMLEIIRQLLLRYGIHGNAADMDCAGDPLRVARLRHSRC